MPALVVDHRRLSYEDYGAGPIALLIHGSPGTARAWARVGERLGTRFRVIAPDLPAYGETTAQPVGEEPAVGHASELIEALVRHVGSPTVMAGHSYGGVVALALALRGNVEIGALALFEPVAMPILALAGESEAFALARAVFDDYFAAFESGNGRAVQKMIDFWFGPEAFEAMPEALTGYLIRETASNIRDVRATFRESYSVDAFRRLELPVLTVVGERSPDTTQRIARVLTRCVPHGSLLTLPGADHALTTTHVDAVAEAISSVAK